MDDKKKIAAAFADLSNALDLVYLSQEKLREKGYNNPVLSSIENYLKQRSQNKTPAEQRDIFRPELFYNCISLSLKNKPIHYKNANKFEEKKTLIHRTPF